jgi:hypothetical protein
VAKSEQDEPQKFRDMKIHEYVPREIALNDASGKFVKVGWVRYEGGSRCEVLPCSTRTRIRLVYGQVVQWHSFVVILASRA